MIRTCLSAVCTEAGSAGFCLFIFPPTSVLRYAYDELTDPKRLYSYILTHKASKGTTYVFLDEVQNVEGFERIIDSLYIQKGIDVYITGSNAKFLSRDLATLLSGRYVTVEMLPLSFAEFVSSTGDTRDLSRKFSSYVETSSFPYVTTLDGKQEEINEYLQGIYNTVILKDVIGRYKISDTMMLQGLLRFMLPGRRNLDIGHILENIIFLELIRRGMDVYIGKVDGEEIDFIANSSDGTVYYQVAATVRDPAADYQDIRRINALDWLLGS